MNSKQMLKTKIKKDQYFRNTAEYNKTPKWELRTKTEGCCLTPKEYKEAGYSRVWK